MCFKQYAFTVTDDPDKNILAEKKILYDYLSEIGLRTTVLIWIKNADKTNLMPIRKVKNYKYGDTLENSEYLEYIKKLSKLGMIPLTGIIDLKRYSGNSRKWW